MLASSSPLALVALLVLLVPHGSAGPIPGVHVPLPIDPTVDFTNAVFLKYLYLVLFRREPDAPGFRTNFLDLEGGMTRDALFAGLTKSAEFQGNPSLQDRGGFVTALYTQLLQRQPSPQEVTNDVANLRAYDGSGSGLTWLQLMQSVWQSAEFKGTNCATGYYTLGAPVNADALLLEDLFAGRAHMQPINASQTLSLSLPSAKNVWDQKLPVLRNPEGSGYIAFTRVFVDPAANHFTISLLTSPDGVSFTEAGQLFSISPSQTFYDAHISVDWSVCPPMYVMSMECIGHTGAASLCTAQSPYPGHIEAWTVPFVAVDGCVQGGGNSVCHTNAAESASTGVSLADGGARYLAWTQVRAARCCWRCSLGAAADAAVAAPRPWGLSTSWSIVVDLDSPSHPLGAVRCCAVLCCVVLCCAVLCCAVLCCAVLCCAVLCCAVQF
jgi:hypothetical protein